MDLIVGVDGGSSKTELVAATTDGERLAFVRGPGSNSHALGAEGTVAVIDALVVDANVQVPVAHGVFFLCGADVPADIAALERAVVRAGWARRTIVDNDAFALLRAGTNAADAVAVICGSGVNAVGRAAGGRSARYPALGWETGDWGGGEMLGREAIFLAARAEDGRGEPTELAESIADLFGMSSVGEVGAAFHYGRLHLVRVGEIAPLVVDAAGRDAIARALVERLAREIGLLVERAFRDLDLDAADVVLGGGMLRSGGGHLHDAVVAVLPAGACPVIVRDPPVLGAALAALDTAGATAAAKQRLREELRAG